MKIRDWFWLLTLLAVGLAWWTDRAALATDNRLLWHSLTTGEKVLIGGDLMVVPRCSPVEAVPDGRESL